MSINCFKFPVRLSKNISPTFYLIKLQPDLSKNKFRGDVSIDLKITEPSPNIVLHSFGLKYQKITLDLNKKPEDIDLKTMKISKSAQMINIPFKLPKGTAKITFNYEGQITDELVGFYKAHGNSSGEIGVTQFESIYARRVFPCCDEPSFKAVFKILITPLCDPLTVLSNMPLAKKFSSKRNNIAYTTYEFEKSPLMSTYLVAFVLGDLRYIEDATGRILIRVYTQKGDQNQAEFALKSAKLFLEFYEDFFGIKYPIPKLDLVAIPDFSAGAMENWGLVTFRDTAILCTENSSQRSKERVAVVVAHELAHQWFGNLVTMDWWTDLWLNEGFASFMEIKVTNIFYEEWGIESESIASQYSQALKLDSLASSHPVEVPIQHAEEIDEVFDHISYLKGSLLVRMVCEYVGVKQFKSAMQNYMAVYQNRNVSTLDLWDMLDRYSGKKVSDMMKNFTEVKGYPVVTVEKLVGGDNQLLLNQCRFVARGGGNLDKKNNVNGEDLWKIPLVLGENQVVLMETENLVLSQHTNCVLNYKASSFFRTNYKMAVLNAINLDELHPLNLFILLNDTHALTCVGDYSEIAVLFNLLLRLKSLKTVHKIVWNEICAVIYDLFKLFEGYEQKPIIKHFRKFAFDVLRKRYSELGWEPKPMEPLDNMKMRTTTISVMARLGDPEVLKIGTKKFELYLQKDEKPNKDLLPVVFTIGCITKGKDCADQLLIKAKKSDERTELTSALRALGNIQEKAKLKEMLSWSKNNKVRKQDFFILVHSIANNKNGRNIAWNWFKENFVFLKHQFPPQLFNHFIQILPNFDSFSMAVEIENFFKDKKMDGSQKSINQAKENIRIKADFLEKKTVEAAKWLEEHYP